MHEQTIAHILFSYKCLTTSSNTWLHNIENICLPATWETCSTGHKIVLVSSFIILSLAIVIILVLILLLLAQRCSHHIHYYNVGAGVLMRSMRRHGRMPEKFLKFQHQLRNQRNENTKKIVTKVVTKTKNKRKRKYNSVDWTKTERKNTIWTLVTGVNLYSN